MTGVTRESIGRGPQNVRFFTWQAFLNHPATPANSSSRAAFVIPRRQARPAAVELEELDRKFKQLLTARKAGERTDEIFTIQPVSKFNSLIWK